MSKPSAPYTPVLQTCSFIAASDLFRGLDALWSFFAESDPPFSWGSNNRTLISSCDLVSYLDSCVLDEPAEALFDTLADRVNALSTDVYVDLEN